jgi:hypothetical protein
MPDAVAATFVACALTCCCLSLPLLLLLTFDAAFSFSSSLETLLSRRTKMIRRKESTRCGHQSIESVAKKR